MIKVKIILLAAVMVLTACNTTREVVTNDRSVEDFMQRMDSLVRAQRITQKDSAWHELVLRQLESIREKTDTSHTLVVDTAGKVIKETLIIRTAKESSSATERQEREVLLHRLEVMDSTLAQMRQQMTHSDSLLQSTQKVVEVQAQLTWWQQFRLSLGNVLLYTLAIFIGVWLWKKRSKP